jgi:hypothetical protein
VRLLYINVLHCITTCGVRASAGVGVWARGFFEVSEIELSGIETRSAFNVLVYRAL